MNAKIVSGIDRYFVLAGLVFAGAGLVLGHIMGESGNHSQMPTHAHIMLAGFVFTFIYGASYRMWPALKVGWLPILQFGLHVIGALALVTALYLLIDGIAEEAALIPLFIIGTLGIVLAWLIFFVLFILKGRDKAVA